LHLSVNLIFSASQTENVCRKKSSYLIILIRLIYYISFSN